MPPKAFDSLSAQRRILARFGLTAPRRGALFSLNGAK